MDALDDRGLSNNVLVATVNNKKTLFLPVYLRVTFKKLTRLEVQSDCGEMSATVILTIYYKGLSQAMLEMLKQRLDVAINDEQFVNLNPDPDKTRDISQGMISASDDESKCEYTIQWRNKFALEMKSEVFWTPFELLELALTITMRSITSLVVGGSQVSIKFNLMDSPGSDLVTKFFLLDHQDFGEYGIASNLIEAEYFQQKEKKKPIIKETPAKQHQIQLKEKVQQGIPQIQQQRQQYRNEEVTRIKLNFDNPVYKSLPATKIVPYQQSHIHKETKKINIRNWHNAAFKLSVYRYPFTTILMVYIPILLLAIINLAIFFQDNIFADRIASIATLMVAYTAFLPTVRKSIPPSPNITVFDIIMYSLFMSSILCLLRGFLDRQKPTEAYDYQWRTDPILVVSTVLVGLSIIIVILAFSLYKCKWQKEYGVIDSLRKKKRIIFQSEQWGNQKCDEYFEALREQGIIRLLYPNEFAEDMQVHTSDQIALTRKETQYQVQGSPLRRPSLKRTISIQEEEEQHHI